MTSSQCAKSLAFAESLRKWMQIIGLERIIAVADPGGGAAGAPQGSRFFRFDIQIFRNVAASGVGVPPPYGKSGSVTASDI